MKRGLKFLKEAKAELNKVSWPSWDDVTRSTLVVLATVVLFTVFVFLADEAIGLVVKKVFG